MVCAATWSNVKREFGERTVFQRIGVPQTLHEVAHIARASITLFLAFNVVQFCKRKNMSRNFFFVLRLLSVRYEHDIEGVSTKISIISSGS